MDEKELPFKWVHKKDGEFDMLKLKIAQMGVVIAASFETDEAILSCLGTLFHGALQVSDMTLEQIKDLFQQMLFTIKQERENEEKEDAD